MIFMKNKMNLGFRHKKILFFAPPFTDNTQQFNLKFGDGDGPNLCRVKM